MHILSAHVSSLKHFTAKPKQFRQHYTFGAPTKGMDQYHSGVFDDERGTWYYHWHDPDAKFHEDVWDGERRWEFKGFVYYPANHQVVLSKTEYEHLWPGLANNGVPDASGHLHPIQLSPEAANSRCQTPLPSAQELMGKISKFRTGYTLAANEGGYHCYTSGLYIKAGTWYEQWWDPDAKWHEDIYDAPRRWKFLGWAFWPANHRTMLTKSQYYWLWPGLANHGMADASGKLHMLRVKTHQRR